MGVIEGVEGVEGAEGYLNHFARHPIVSPLRAWHGKGNQVIQFRFGISGMDDL